MTITIAVALLMAVALGMLIASIVRMILAESGGNLKKKSLTWPGSMGFGSDGGGAPGLAG